MPTAEFDDYAEDFDGVVEKQLRFFEKGRGYFADCRARAARRLLAREPASILEYGCGTGVNLAPLAAAFPGARIHGADVSARSLEVAARANPRATLFRLDGREGGGRHDLVFMVNVLHHVPGDRRPAVLADAGGMVADGGSLIVFEHNPFNPVTRRLVNTCVFDRGVELIRPGELRRDLAGAGFEASAAGYILFFPSILRGLRRLEWGMRKIPLGGQYYVLAGRGPAGGEGRG